MGKSNGWEEEGGSVSRKGGARKGEHKKRSPAGMRGGD